jgi:small-conductance mechanosensitive channel
VPQATLRDDRFVGKFEAVNRQPDQLDTSHDQATQPELPRSRPLRAVISLVLTIAAAVAVNLYGIPFSVKTIRDARRAGIVSTIPILTGHLITVGASVAFVIFGLVSAFAWASWARGLLGHVIGTAYASIFRYVLILFGTCVIVVVTLSMLGFRVGQLVLGGTVTAVFVTIAAQQALANVFAGMMLQFAHPFRVGDSIWVRAGALSGTIEGTVVEISIVYVTLENDEGRVLLPNSVVLAAAVSPVRTAPRDGLLAHRYSRFGRTSPRPPMSDSYVPPVQPPQDQAPGRP